MKRILSVLILLLVGLPLSGQTKGINEIPLIKVESDIQSVETITFKKGQFKAFESGKGVKWSVYPATKNATPKSIRLRPLKAGSAIVGWDLDTKAYRDYEVPKDKDLLLVTVDGSAEGEFTLVKRKVTKPANPEDDPEEVVEFEKRIIIEGSEEVPDKKPDNPPTPKPTPVTDDNVLGVDGLACVFIIETGDATKLTPGQNGVLYSIKLRKAIEAVAAKMPDGEAALRIVDQNEDVSGDLKFVQTAMKLKRDNLPWAIISKPGKKSYQGPIRDVDDMFRILKTFE